MRGNTFGHIFQLSTYGESHGSAIGGIIQGCPSNIKINIEEVKQELNRRRPGQSKIVTQRKEPDDVIFSSGLFEGKTTGFPMGFQIINTNQKSKDYDHLKDNFRPSHADYVYDKKYANRDYRGGGRSSARETANWVVGGAIAKQFLKSTPIKINAFVSSVGHLKLSMPYQELHFDNIEKNPVRCPDLNLATKMEQYIKEIRKQGDTVGGVIQCVVSGVPVGLGEPIFNKLHAELAKAMLTINAAKGFEYGSGFEGTTMKGSQHNDVFNLDGSTKTNHSGGIQGGISTGMDIYFSVAFKPVATIMRNQKSINKEHQETVIQGKGRHDPCVVPRAVPIVESLTALVMADFVLINRTHQKNLNRGIQ